MINGNRIFRADRWSRFSGVSRVALACSGPLLNLFVSGCTAHDSDPPSIADLPTFDIEQDLRIDGYEADLVPIGWMGVAEDGTIAVIQHQINGVRFFDASGNSLGVVGRQGEGPGEFQFPAQAGWIGDRLWVNDFMLKRATLISTEPAFIRTLPPVAGVRPAPEDQARFPSSSMVVPYALYPDGNLLVNMPGGQAFEGIPLFLVSGDGVIERLVLEIPRDPAETIDVSSGSRVVGTKVPFYPSPIWAVASDGNRIGVLTMDLTGPEAEAFKVTLYDALGGEVFSRAYPFEGVPIPEEVVDSVVELWGSRLGIEREMRSRIPPIYPPVEKMLLGADGRTWIGLRSGDESEAWLILGPEGDPEGRVVLPARTRLHVANATHVWALERDELDVESIVRSRIHKKE